MFCIINYKACIIKVQEKFIEKLMNLLIIFWPLTLT